MRVTLNWLREFVDLPDGDPAEISRVLAGLGFATESMHHLESRFSGVVIARVVEVRKHPDADRLRVARLDDGSIETEVVCGAWNFEAGATVAWARPGSQLAGGFEVGERKIRGIRSPGMIASERELGLGEDHEGILVLEGDEELGADFGSLVPYPDWVLDVEVNTNRPDCMSVLGLARELAAHYGVAVAEPAVAVPEVGRPSTITVTLDDPVGCPRYVAREVRGLVIRPSPLGMRLRLAAVGIRPINNVVDATNYVLVEMGHPTHVFDAGRLGGHIVVRRARPGEALRTLDGVERSLFPGDLVIADQAAPVALAGVMGGEPTEVGDATTDAVIEAAYFDPPAVMFTAARHGLHTEASARFQRGMDPAAAARAADRVAMLLAAHAGGSPAPGRVDAYPEPIGPAVIVFPLAEVERVTGTSVPRSEVVGYLTSLGFEVEGEDPLRVTVPTRRPDVTRPVDFVEEVARLRGYDSFSSTLATGPGFGLPDSLARRRILRQVLVGAGYSEAMTLPFLGSGDLDRLGLPETDPRRRGIEVIRPLREEEGILRTTLLPGLLGAVANNIARGVADIALFELGAVFLAGGALPDQPEMLGFAAVGSTGGGWFGSGRARDALDAVGLWEVIAGAMDVGDVTIRQASPPVFHPERSAELVVGDEVIGAIGELHPRVASAYGISGRVAVGDLEVQAVLSPPGLWQFRDVSVYPPVIFDLAFDLPGEATGGGVVAAIRTAGGEIVERVEVFDEFRGPPLGEGRKSLAIRLSLRAQDRTLTDEEVAPIRERIAHAVETSTGGRLRSG